MTQGVQYLYETEIKRIQNLMGVDTLQEQGLGGLLNPLGGMGGLLKTYKWFESFNEHDWLTFIDITSGVLGMFPTPAAPIFLAVSWAACNRDGVLYLKEGDPYMGGLVLSFCLIPLGEWIRILPGAKSIISKGTKYAFDLLKKAKSLSGKKILSISEKQVVREAELLIKELSKKADEIAQLTRKYFITRYLQTIVKGGGKLLFGTVLLLSKTTWAIGRPFVLLSGIYYTYDEIYLALYGTDDKKLKLRNDSSFQQLIRFLKVVTNKEIVEEQAKKYLSENIDQIVEDSDKLVQIDVEGYKSDIKKSEEGLIYPSTTSSASPSFENVLSKKIDINTGEPYVIKKGQKGDSVIKIQKMLEKLDLTSTLKGYDDKNKSADGDFGDNTMDAVILFQSENKIKETGVVDSQTLDSILKKINLK